MPKVRRVKSPSTTDCNRSYPYPSNFKNIELHKPMNLLGSVDEMKEWEEASCPICMESPHNGVLLKCSSHEKGCRPYMCNTSYRHSNCLDQFCKSFASHLSSEVLEEIPVTSRVSHGREVQSDPPQPSQCGSQLKPKLICPLCRGEIYGYMVLEPARRYMNSKPRSCSSETCEFQGTYPELRKHARSEHPSVRPSEVDPLRQCDWLRMEQERDLEDLFSSIHASSGADRDTILTGGLADFMSSFFHEIFSSLENVNRIASLLSNSRHRMPLYDRRSGIMHRVSNDTQTNQSARWRSNLPSAHQLERIARSRVRANFPFLSSRDLEAEANRTARWRTNLSSLRTPRDVHQFYRDLSAEVTSSTRIARASQGTQTNPQSESSSSRRIPGRQLRWRDQRWSTNNNQQ
ncbi:lysosomal alpha-mannosidase [Spatholobus suberectus]|nr:lysosomal alpha-mannosidase [Spatholobus suberectus]